MLTDVERAGRSALAGADLPGRLHDWYSARSEAGHALVTRVPFAELDGWHFQPDTGNLAHRNGAFFTVEGLDVHSNSGPVRHWQQPIIRQPEIGILGIAIRRIGGRVHCLMQAKMEPGNVNGVQLSPTVQATWSNFTRKHGGSAVPYLGHFTKPGRGRVIADVLQSEQGSWFLGKRNRNMVVELGDEDLPEHPDFHWVALADLRTMFGIDNLVNMDTRVVLSCLAGVPNAVAKSAFGEGDDFRAQLRRSFTEGHSLHTDLEVRSWFTEQRTMQRMHSTRMALAAVRNWRRDEDEIGHEQGRHFSIIGVRVRAASREVSGWCQPMLLPRGRGVVAFLTRPFGGVLHMLVRSMAQPGLRDVPELGPSVQCRPENYEHVPAAGRPHFVDAVLGAPPGRIRYDSILSEEGGRFYHAENRYLVVEADESVPDDPPEGFLWLTAGQIARLLQHSHYVNVEARSLMACLYSMTGVDP